MHGVAYCQQRANHIAYRLVVNSRSINQSFSLQVYWLPPDSEDKISLSMTVLLAFSVFLFVVNDMTPASSDSTPIMG